MFQRPSRLGTCQTSSASCFTPATLPSATEPHPPAPDRLGLAGRERADRDEREPERFETPAGLARHRADPGQFPAVDVCRPVKLDDSGAGGDLNDRARDDLGVLLARPAAGPDAYGAPLGREAKRLADPFGQ